MHLAALTIQHRATGSRMCVATLWPTSLPRLCRFDLFKLKLPQPFFGGRVFQCGLSFFCKCASAKLSFKTRKLGKDKLTLLSRFQRPWVLFFLFHTQDNNKDVFISFTWNITGKLCPDTFNQQSSAMVVHNENLRRPGGLIMVDGGVSWSPSLTPLKFHAEKLCCTIWPNYKTWPNYTNCEPEQPPFKCRRLNSDQQGFQNFSYKQQTFTIEQKKNMLLENLLVSKTTWKQSTRIHW